MLVAIDVASPQIVELLLLHGADCGKAVEAVSYWGQPLHRALYSHKCPRESYKQMFRLLVQATVCAPPSQQQQQTASAPTAAVRNKYLKPRLHQIHVAGYMYPGRATCVRIQMDRSGYKLYLGYMYQV